VNAVSISATEFNRLDGKSAALVDQDDFISGDGAGATSNGSGLEAGTGGIGLLQGCANNEILKWVDGTSVWNCAADATGISDSRLKINVAEVSSVLGKVDQIRLVDFDFDCDHEYFDKTLCDTRDQTGVIAQELAQVFPELVYEQDGYYRVRYDALSIYTLKAVQELSGMVDELMALKGQVNDLEGRVANLENSGLTNENGDAVYIENLTVGQMTINMDLFTRGLLTVSGNANFQAEAFFQELVTFGNNVVFTRDVQFQDTVSFSNNTGGYALINPGQQTVHVSFTKPFAQIPIVSVSLTDGKFAQYSYKNVTTEGFDIVLNLPATEQLQFSWIALSVTNPNTVSQP
jgi:hypothetical protein